MFGFSPLAAAPLADDGARIIATGVFTTAQVGSVSVTGEASVTPTGVSTTTSVGTVTVTPKTSVLASGIESSAAVGSVSVITNVAVSVTGVESITAAGTIPQVAITLTGVSTTCAIGELFFWSPAAVDQTLAWTNISPSDTTWSQITPSGPPVWTEISR